MCMTSSSHENYVSYMTCDSERVKLLNVSSKNVHCYLLLSSHTRFSKIVTIRALGKRKIICELIPLLHGLQIK